MILEQRSVVFLPAQPEGRWNYQPRPRLETTVAIGDDWQAVAARPGADRGAGGCFRSLSAVAITTGGGPGSLKFAAGLSVVGQQDNLPADQVGFDGETELRGLRDRVGPRRSRGEINAYD